MQEDYYVYILECNDTTLYTGITKNIKKRVDEHNNSKKGAKYTRPRRPVKVVYSEICENRSSACTREYQIKQLKRAKKLELIQNYTIDDKNI